MRPAWQKKEEYAPGVLGCVAVGVMLLDEGARDLEHVELRLEAWGMEW